MCVCVCVCLFVHVCVCVLLFMYVHTLVLAEVIMFVHMYSHECECMCMDMYMCLCVCACVVTCVLYQVGLSTGAGLIERLQYAGALGQLRRVSEETQVLQHTLAELSVAPYLQDISTADFRLVSIRKTQGLPHAWKSGESGIKRNNEQDEKNTPYVLGKL